MPLGLNAKAHTDLPGGLLRVARCSRDKTNVDLLTGDAGRSVRKVDVEKENRDDKRDLAFHASIKTNDPRISNPERANE